MQVNSFGGRLLALPGQLFGLFELLRRPLLQGQRTALLPRKPNWHRRDPTALRTQGTRRAGPRPIPEARSYIVKQNGLSLVVNPHVNQLWWVDDRNLVIKNPVGESHSIEQMLGLAWKMTAPGSCQTHVPNTGGANLQGANLEYCNLSGYNLSGDNLQNANLQYTDLQNANLRGANLHGADLANAFAMAASFQGANLQNADLAGATLTGLSASQETDFDGANMQDAILTGASCGSPNYITASGANTQGAVNVPAACNPPL